MKKFNPGDKCRVVKNLLSPYCIGNIVEIIGVIRESEGGKTLYKIRESDDDGYYLDGFAIENCLELIENDR